MVAVAGSRLTADLFLQMTATLAHISNMENVTRPVAPAWQIMTFVQTDRGLMCLIQLIVFPLKTLIRDMVNVSSQTPHPDG